MFPDSVESTCIHLPEMAGCAIGTAPFFFYAEIGFKTVGIPFYLNVLLCKTGSETGVINSIRIRCNISEFQVFTQSGREKDFNAFVIPIGCCPGGFADSFCQIFRHGAYTEIKIIPVRCHLKICGRFFTFICFCVRNIRFADGNHFPSGIIQRFQCFRDGDSKRRDKPF